MTDARYRCRSCRKLRQPSQQELNEARRELCAAAETELEALAALTSTDREIAAAIEFCPMCAELEKVAEVWQ